MIKIMLIRASEGATVTIEGPESQSKSDSFQLLWMDPEEWKAVFSSLELFYHDESTWPSAHSIIEKAEELGLFENRRPKKDRLSSIGYELYNSVFRDELKSFFKGLLNNLNETPKVIQLHINEEGSILQAYPWELLCDGSGFLFDNRNIVLVRHVAFTAPISPLELYNGINILLVDPRPTTPHEDYPRLPLQEREILRSLSNNQIFVDKIDEKSEPSATIDSLHDFFLKHENRPHVLHIDTHGDYGWLCDDCGSLYQPNEDICIKCDKNKSADMTSIGYLAFQNNSGEIAWTSGDTLARTISSMGVQLVFISACKSGLAAGSSTFNSVAGAMIKEGIPAVIAMQFSLDTSSIEKFAEVFYMLMLKGKPLTSAIAEARLRLSVEASGNTDSWYRPVFYLRTDENDCHGNILNIKKPINITPKPIPFPYGALKPDSNFYIKRETDITCMNQLQIAIDGDKTALLVNSPWQTGKSSLMQKMIHDLNSGSKVVEYAYIDFQMFPENLFEDIHQFLMQFCQKISYDTKIPLSRKYFEKFWKSGISPTFLCSQFLKDEVLTYIKKPLIICIDEAQRIFTSRFDNDFFNMLRAIMNTPNITRLSILVSCSPSFDVFLKDSDASPFRNIADIIVLNDFTFQETKKLNELYQEPLTLGELEDLFNLLDGHPFLTHIFINRLAQNQDSFDSLFDTAIDENGFYHSHLHRYWQHIVKQKEYANCINRICNNQICPEDEIFHKLVGVGLIKIDRKEIKFRNELYRQYFTKLIDNYFK